MGMFGTEAILGPLGPFERAAVALLIVVVVAGIAFYLYRLIARPALGGALRGKQARLAITDVASIDQRRKLILVRRDDVEHLVMIGGPADIVVETDIRRNAPARPLHTAARETAGGAQNKVSALRDAAKSLTANVWPSNPEKQPAPKKPIQAPAADRANPTVTRPSSPPVAPLPNRAASAVSPSSDPEFAEAKPPPAGSESTVRATGSAAHSSVRLGTTGTDPATSAPASGEERIAPSSVDRPRTDATAGLVSSSAEVPLRPDRVDNENRSQQHTERDRRTAATAQATAHNPQTSEARSAPSSVVEEMDALLREMSTGR